MFTSIDTTLVGGIVALTGMLISSVITWLYLRKAKSVQEQYLTRGEKYIYPLLALAGTSLITCLGLVFMLGSSASPQMTYEFTWGVSFAISISCSGLLLIWLMLSYLINLWWHERNSKPRQDH
jgi:hypothetical protein